MTDFPTAPPPPMPPMSSAVPPTPNAGPAPVTVTVTFWLTLVAALTWLAQGVVTIFEIPAAMHLAETTTQKLGHPITETQLHAAILIGIVVGEVFTLVVIVALVLCALFVRRGASWARILLTVMAALTLLNATKVFGMVGSALLIASVILIWIAPTNRWFSAVRYAKRAGSGR